MCLMVPASVHRLKDGRNRSVSPAAGQLKITRGSLVPSDRVQPGCALSELVVTVVKQPGEGMHARAASTTVGDVIVFLRLPTHVANEEISTTGSAAWAGAAANVSNESITPARATLNKFFFFIGRLQPAMRPRQSPPFQDFMVYPRVHPHQLGREPGSDRCIAGASDKCATLLT